MDRIVYELRDEAHVFGTETSTRIENLAAIAEQRVKAGTRKQTIWKQRPDESPRLLQVIANAR